MGTLELKGPYPATLSLADILYVDKVGGTTTEDGYITIGELRDLIVPPTYVQSKGDLPAPAAGVITITESNKTYIIIGLIDLGSDKIVVTGDAVHLLGHDALSGFTSTNTGVLIYAAASLTVIGLNLIDPSSSQLLHCVDGANSNLLCEKVVFIGSPTTDCALVDNYSSAIFMLCAFTSGRDGITFANTVTNSVVHFNRFDIGLVGKHIDYNGSTHAATAIDSNAAELSATSTFLDLAVDNGNLTATGGGTITDNKTNNAAGGTISVGYSPLDIRWLSIGNNTILSSDRIIPAGWGYYVDGDTVTQTAIAGEENAIKFSVDGVGVNSESGYLPHVIRGISELWDIATNDIKGITSGDSYTVRIGFAITAKSGAPALLSLVTDIGSTDLVTIPVTERTFLTPNSFPIKINFTESLFSLTTFITNGAQILMYTDAGTLDIEARSILIERVTSGAS